MHSPTVVLKLFVFFLTKKKLSPMVALHGTLKGCVVNSGFCFFVFSHSKTHPFSGISFIFIGFLYDCRPRLCYLLLLAFVFHSET